MAEGFKMSNAMDQLHCIVLQKFCNACPGFIGITMRSFKTHFTSITERPAIRPDWIQFYQKVINNFPVLLQ